MSIVSEYDRLFGAAPTQPGNDAQGPSADIAGLITAAAERYGVDPNVMLQLAQRESSLNPAAKNPNSSAGGLFQFIDSTWNQYGGGRDKYNPEANADAAARMLRDNLKRFNGDYDLALAAHHVGPGKAEQALRDRSVGDRDVSTQDWLRSMRGEAPQAKAAEPALDLSSIQPVLPEGYSSGANYQTQTVRPSAPKDAQQGVDWGKKLGAAIDNYQAGLWSIPAAMGSEYALKAMLENKDAANKGFAEAGGPQSWDEMQFGENFGQYFGHLFVQSAPYLAEFAATGFGLGSALKKGLATTAEQIAAKAAAEAIAKGASTAAAAKVGNAAANGFFGTLGGVIGSYPSATGDILTNQHEQAGKFDLPAAAALGIPYAALNAAGVEGMLMRAAARSGVPEIAASVAGQGIKGALGRAAITGAETGLVEGTTETGQEVANQLGRMAVDPNASLTSDDALARYKESFIAGGLMGGIPGAVAGPFRKPEVPAHSPLQAAAAAAQPAMPAPGADPVLAGAANPALGAPGVADDHALVWSQDQGFGPYGQIPAGLTPEQATQAQDIAAFMSDPQQRQALREYGVQREIPDLAAAIDADWRNLGQANPTVTAEQLQRMQGAIDSLVQANFSNRAGYQAHSPRVPRLEGDHPGTDLATAADLTTGSARREIDMGTVERMGNLLPAPGGANEQAAQPGGAPGSGAGGAQPTQLAPGTVQDEYAQAWQADTPAASPTVPTDAAAEAAAAPELVEVKDGYGQTYRVDRAELDSDKTLLRLYTKNGKPKPGPRLHRENIDTDGSQRAAQQAAEADNQMFEVVTAKDGSAFATEAGAKMHATKNGYADTHEAVPAAQVHPGAQGFVLKRKAQQTPNVYQSSDELVDQSAPVAAAEVLAVPEESGTSAPIAVDQYLTQNDSGHWIMMRPAPDEATRLAAIDEMDRRNAGEATKAAVAQARAETNTAPTPAQIEAENYKKGRLDFHGLKIALENPKGSTRSGTDRDGKRWETTMRADYGHFERGEGADGDKLDTFIGPDTASAKVFVIDQIDPASGAFDEHKVMLGYKSLNQAKAGYLANYAKGWKGLGAITPMSLDEFKAWRASGKTQQPVAYQAPVATADNSGGGNDGPPNGPPPAAAGGEESGPFGPIYRGLTNQPEAAIEKLLQEQQGEVPDAFLHPEIGTIAFIYGDAKMGLRHIAERRGLPFVRQIPALLRVGRVVPDENGLPRTYIVDSHDPAHVAVIRLEWDRQQKTWLVTAYTDAEGKFAGGEKRADTPAAVASEVPASDGVVFSHEPGTKSISQRKPPDTSIGPNGSPDDSGPLNPGDSSGTGSIAQSAAMPNVAAATPDVAPEISGKQASLSEKAADPYAEKWFGSQEKAQAFIAKQGAGATHEAKLIDKQWRIVPKAAKKGIHETTKDEDAAAENDPIAALKTHINTLYRAKAGNNFGAGMQVTAEKMYQAIVGRNAVALAGILDSANKVSRAVFEDIIKAKLPSTVKGTHEAVTAFLGKIDAALAEQPATPSATVGDITEPSITRRANPGNMADQSFVARAFLKQGDIPIKGEGATEAEALLDLMKDADRKRADAAKPADTAPAAALDATQREAARMEFAPIEGSNEYIVRAPNKQGGYQRFARFAVSAAGKPTKIKYFFESSGIRDAVDLALKRWQPEAAPKLGADETAQKAAPAMEKRNIWIPNMTVSKLERLLAKEHRSVDDLEDLRDFKYFLLNDEQSAAEKGFMVQLAVDGAKPTYRIKNSHWLTNIEHALNVGAGAAAPKARWEAYEIVENNGRWLVREKTSGGYQNLATFGLDASGNSQRVDHFFESEQTRAPVRQAIAKWVGERKAAHDKGMSELAAADAKDDLDAALASSSIGWTQGTDINGDPTFTATINGKSVGILQTGPRSFLVSNADAANSPSNTFRSFEEAAKAAEANARPESVASLYGGGPDPLNSPPLRELGGLQAGERVKVPSRTVGDSTIEFLFTRNLAGMGPLPMARVVNDAGKRLDIGISELTKLEVTQTPAPAERAEPKQVAPASDFDALLDSVLDQEFGAESVDDKPGLSDKSADKSSPKPAAAKPKKPATPQVPNPHTSPLGASPRTAGEAGASAVKNAASGMANAAKGLNALFAPKPGRLGSGPVFDEDTYAQAKPYFQMALADLKTAAADAKDMLVAIVRGLVGNGLDRAAIKGMSPYLERFVKEQLETPESPAYDESKEAAGHDTDTTQSQSDFALEGPSADEVRGAGGRGQAGSRSTRRRQADHGGNRDAEDAGLSGARGGRGGAADVRPAGPAQSPQSLGLFDGLAESAPANLPAVNFVITPDLELGKGSESVKFADNIAAIHALKAIEAQQRRATPDEQRKLARYVGWGGLANAFPDAAGNYKDGWKERGELLKSLLTPAEYKTAASSTRNAHYTSETVVRAMWDAVKHLGFTGGAVLEPSSGSGNFIGMMPPDVAGQFVGVEFDGLTARLAAALYPQAHIFHSGFQKVPLADESFDLAIGNPPFGKESLNFQFKPELKGVSIHNQFFRASLDAVKPGGLQVMVVSRYLLDAQDSSSRLALAAQANLLGAIRLPDTAFKENARTEVVTDILFLQKLSSDEQAMRAEAINAARARPEKNPQKESERKALAAAVPDWVQTIKVRDPLGGEDMVVNSYFASNPQMVMGTMERSGSMQAPNYDEAGNRIADITVRLDRTAELPGMLAAAIKRLPQKVVPDFSGKLEDIRQRFEEMADSIRIALDGLEAGDIAFDADGHLNEVVEREAPGGQFELYKRRLTPASAWSPSLSMDREGRWYRAVQQLDTEGKPVKVKDAKGQPTKRNVYTREVFEREADIPATLRLGESRYERLVPLTQLRDLLKQQLVLESSDATEAEMEVNRERLSAAYDAFVAKHGHLNDAKNANLLSDMPDGALILALEMAYRPELTAARAKKLGEDPRPASADRAAILSRRVVVPYAPPGRAESATDALVISMAELGKLDLGRMAELLDTDEQGVIEQLHDQRDEPLMFKDPELNEWQSRDRYLSGQVRRKLAAARAAGLQKNVEALAKVQPEAWTAEQISPVMGAAWVPVEVYEDFIQHLTGEPGRVRFSRLTNTYEVRAKDTAKGNEFRSPRASTQYLIGQILNSAPVRITFTDDEGKTHLLEEETAMAQIKAKQITAEFADWVYADRERRTRLVEVFNEMFNTRVQRQYDGQHLILPGKVPDEVIAMRRHQKNVIWRGIQERFMLIDHAVGAGKTFSAIARAMERRRMGLSKKPMIVVPNHMVEQFASDAYRLYPGAKVLAAGKKDFEAKHRRRLFAKVATGDWDLVIVPHSSFKFIQISPEAEERFIEEELKLAEQAIKDAQEAAAEDMEASSGRPFKPLGVKQAEAVKTKLETRLANIRGNRKGDKLLTFEQMGVDDLTIDEAHEFKNLFYHSKMTGVRGMGDRSGSEKSFDLYQKIRVLRESPTGSVTFMTGTPISNSAVEMYTMLRYLAADELAELGLEHFDAWRAQYVDASTAWEPTESGNLKEVTRLGRNWSNMRSLMDLYYSITDAVTLDDIKAWYVADTGKDFPVPKVKGGQRQQIVVKPTPAQEEILKQVIADFERLPNIQDVKKRNATRLRLMDRARKVSLDARAVDGALTEGVTGGKIDRATQEIKRIYDQWQADKGTQLVFLDRSVPKAKGDDKLIKQYDELLARRAKALSDNDREAYDEAIEALDKFDANEIVELRAAQAGGWNAYQQIKDSLVAAGIPAKEIRFIQEASSDEQKQALFDAVKAGEVRILLGSTQRMGAGTNVQDRLVALHHIDINWKPSDIEQREGRIVRQGNKLLEKHGDGFEVEVIPYVTERTMDAKMWDLNSTKLRMINGIRKYAGEFNMEFDDEESMGMAEIAALASGDPLLLERVKLSGELDKLDLVRRGWSRKIGALKDRIHDAERNIANLPGQIEQTKANVKTLRDVLGRLEEAARARSVSVEGRLYNSVYAASVAAQAIIKEQRGDNEKARFSLLVDGERVTSMEALDRAITARLGDEKPFAMEIDGKAVIQRKEAAHQIAEIATRLVRGMLKDDQSASAERIGSMFGLHVEIDVSRKWRSVYQALSLVDGAGRSLVTVEAEVPGVDVKSLLEPQVTAQAVRHLLAKLDESMLSESTDFSARWMENRLAEAHRDLPPLQAELARNGAFPQQAELEQKQARLEEVIKILSGRSATAVAEAEAPQPQDEAPLESRADGNAFTPDAYDARAFAEAVDRIAALKEAPRDTVLTMGDTPPVLLALGAKDIPVQMASSLVHKATRPELRGHDVSAETIRNLPALLADPIMVFKSETEADSVVALIDAVDVSGRHVIVAVHLGAGKSGFNQINKITSVYGKDRAQDIERWMNGNLRYYHTQNAPKWLHAARLQLPGANTIRERNPSVITEADVVNWHAHKESRADEDAEFRRIDPAEADTGEFRRIAETPTPAEIRAAFVKAFGDKTVRQLEAKGLVHIVANPAALAQVLPQAKIRRGTVAMFSGGKAYFIASRMDPETAHRELLHEIGEHYGLARMLGGEGYTALMQRVKDLHAADDAPTVEAWAYVRKHYPEEAEGSVRFMHEVLAQLGQNAEVQAKPWWKELLAAVKRFLVQLGFTGMIKVADIQDLVLHSLKTAAKPDGGPRGGLPADPVLASSVPESGVSRPAEFWLRYAAQDDAFRYKRSAATDIEQIFADYEAGAEGSQFTRAETVTTAVPSLDNPFEFEHVPMVKLYAKTKTGGEDVFMTVNPFPKVADGYFIRINDMDHFGHWIEGAKAYQMGMVWAINNGYRLFPDATLIPINRLRRSEATISMWLKYREKAAGIIPHREQFIGLLDEADWAQVVDAQGRETEATIEPLSELGKKLDALKSRLYRDPTGIADPEKRQQVFYNNLENLQIASAALVERRMPEIANVTIDAEGTISDPLANLSDSGLDFTTGGTGVLGRIPSMAAKTGIGVTSYRRAVVTRFLHTGTVAVPGVGGSGATVGGQSAGQQRGQQLPDAVQRLGVLAGGTERHIPGDVVARALSALGTRALYAKDTDSAEVSVAPGGADAPLESRVGNTLENFKDYAARTLQPTTAKSFNSWWHKTVGTMYHLSTINRPFKRVFDAVQAFMRDVARLAKRAEELAPDLIPQGFFAKPLTVEDSRAIADPIFKATLHDHRLSEQELRQGWFEVEVPLDMAAPDEDVQFGDDGRYDGGRTRTVTIEFAPLSDDQVRYAGQFRAAIDQSLEDLGRAELLRLFRSGKVDPGLLARAWAGTRTAHDFGAQVLGEVTEQARAQGIENIAEDWYVTARDTYNRMTELQDKGYAPLMRFGEYSLYFYKTEEDESGELTQVPVYYTLFETERERNAALKDIRAALEAEHGEALHHEIGIVASKHSSLFDGLTPELARGFAEAFGIEQDEAFQEYLKKAVNNRSALKRLLHRKGTAGFSEDATRVLAAFLVSNSRRAAALTHLTSAREAADAIDRKHGDVKDMAEQLIDYVANPKEEAGPLRGFLFFNFLGGSVASALVNLTQTVLQTAPYLYQFAKQTESGRMGLAKRLAKNQRLAFQMVIGETMGKGLPEVGADLQAALDRAAAEGITKPHEIHQLMAEAGGQSTSRSLGRWVARKLGKDEQAWGSQAEWTAQRFLKGWGSFFGMAEESNRLVAFMSAYELARERGLGQNEAYAEAAQAVHETQGVYNKGSRPMWARGAVGATVFTFKTFSVQYLEFLRRLYKHDKEAFVVALAMLVALAGVSGLPGQDDLDDLIDTIGQWMGFATNSKKARRQMVEATVGQVFGQVGSDFVLNGISAVLPIDVHARLGLGNIIPGSAMLHPGKTSEQKLKQALEVVGPVGGLINNSFVSMERLAKGDLDHAFAAIAPSAVKNAYVGGKMVATGYAEDMKGRRVTDVDLADGLFKAIGFQPTQVADNYARRAEHDTDKSIYNNRRSEISEKWAEGMAHHDAKLTAEALSDLRAWNRDHPDMRITIRPGDIARRAQALRSSARERYVKAAPKPMRERIAEETEAES